MRIIYLLLFPFHRRDMASVVLNLLQRSFQHRASDKKHKDALTKKHYITKLLFMHHVDRVLILHIVSYFCSSSFYKYWSLKLDTSYLQNVFLVKHKNAGCRNVSIHNSQFCVWVGNLKLDYRYYDFVPHCQI